MPVVVVRQRKAWRRRDGVFLYFEVCIFHPLLHLGLIAGAGQCRCHCQQQGGHEGLCHRWTCSKRMRRCYLLLPMTWLMCSALGRPMASYRSKGRHGGITSCYHTYTTHFLIFGVCMSLLYYYDNDPLQKSVG